jgi:hypothetical protein
VRRLTERGRSSDVASRVARCDIVRRLSLLIFLSACATSTAAVSSTTAVTSPVVASPHGAFVVYFARETLVIPTYPDHEIMTIPGLLVQDDAEGMDGALTYLTVTNEIPRRAHCPCAHTPNACEVSVAPLVTRVRRENGAFAVSLNNDAVADMASCTCLISRIDALASASDEMECDGQEDAELIGFLGGALFVRTTISEGDCEDYAVTEFETIDAVESADDPHVGDHSAEYERSVCVRDLVRDPEALATARRIECSAPSEEDEEACALCEENGVSGTYYALSRGRIYELTPAITESEEVTGMRSEPATPEVCASVNDPCGDPSGLPIPPGAPFWVANDGGSSLVQQGDRWLVLVRGHAAASVIHVGPRAHPVGVRYHADARPLMTELASHAMHGAANEVPIVARRVRVSAACESDDDCLDAGMCYGFCGTDHACHEDGCDESHECEGESDTVCDFAEMTCVEPSSLRPSAREILAPADARYARTNPRDHGAGWARRCHAHIARGRIDEAYGACVRALGANPSPVVLVAVFRDLAEIASREGRLEEEAAFDMYARFAEEEIEEEAPPPSRPRGRRHR